MNQYQYEFNILGNYINGKFQIPEDPQGEWNMSCPGDLEDQFGAIQYSYKSVDDAICAAKEAFPAWKKKSNEERAGYLNKYQSILEKRKKEIAGAISRETGKPLWESLSEVTTMINKIKITLEDSMDLIKEVAVTGIGKDTQGFCRHKPLGVLAVIGPFNFPGHLPNGHIIPALASGNTVVFKPASKTPFTGQILAECLDEAEIPRGVFNLIQGEQEVGRRLCVHQDVQGILFTGSYEVGLRIKQDTLQQHWKLLALEMGGKNSAIVWDDCHLESAIYETLTGAFLTAGQRCTSTSRIILHKKIFNQFLEGFHKLAKTLKVGHAFDEPFMGPLIDGTSVDRYLKFQGTAVREGFELVMRGKTLDLEKKGHYVTPSICSNNNLSLDQAKKSVYYQTELFSPNVLMIATDDIDEAVAFANLNQYGLANSVFTQNKDTFNQCFLDLESGIINWNKTTVGASSKLPFGGLKKSGNHFPTALYSTRYCTYPVASIEAKQPTRTEFPGMGN